MNVPGPDSSDELARLRAYPFLEPLPEVLLRKLRPNLVERSYRPGDLILRAGEYSDAAYYLKEGVVELRFSVTGTASQARAADAREAARPVEAPGSRDGFGPVQRNPLGADGTVILADIPVDVNLHQRTLLAAGELFGEVNALARYALSTDVIAMTDVVCLAIRTPALRTLFKQKAIAWFKEQVDGKYRDRTLAQHLRQVTLFEDLPDAAIERLRTTADLVSFEPGNVIAAQDAVADAFYLVRGGNVKVAVRAGTRDLAVTYLRKGDYAGEIALLLDDAWPFSLEALEYVELVKIPRATFQEVITEHPVVGQRLWDEAVRRLKQRGALSRNPLASQYLQMAMDTGLIHGESVLLIDLDTCTRCDDCVRACADTHGGTPRFIREDRLIAEGQRYQHWMVPLACYQCSDPACLVGCPTGAITRPLGTLEVTIDPATCIGCGNCARRCPWDNIVNVPVASPRPDGVGQLATKCDLCIGRADGPACVQMCPHGSSIRISFKDIPTVVRTLAG